MHTSMPTFCSVVPAHNVLVQKFISFGTKFDFHGYRRMQRALESQRSAAKKLFLHCLCRSYTGETKRRYEQSRSYAFSHPCTQRVPMLPLASLLDASHFTPPHQALLQAPAESSSAPSTPTSTRSASPLLSARSREVTVNIREQLAQLFKAIPPTGGVYVPDRVRRSLAIVVDHFTPNSRPLPALVPLPNHTAADGIASIATDIPLNRESTLELLLRYELGHSVEYPRTSATGKIGHLFQIDASAWVNPVEFVVYSQGSPHGATVKDKPVYCRLLVDSTGSEVPCRQTHSTCEYTMLL